MGASTITLHTDRDTPQLSSPYWNLHFTWLFLVIDFQSNRNDPSPKPSALVDKLQDAFNSKKLFSTFEMHGISKPLTWTVYIIKCADNTHYVGCTSNLEKRLVRHNRGEVHYTSTRLPIEVLTYTVFHDKYKAYAFEKYLKSGSGRAFMYKRLVDKLLWFLPIAIRTPVRWDHGRSEYSYLPDS